MEKLAIDGGKPVRKKMLHTRYPGGSMFDEKEIKEVIEVLKSKSPFDRYRKV